MICCECMTNITILKGQNDNDEDHDISYDDNVNNDKDDVDDEV